VARGVLEGRIADPTGGATYFYSGDDPPGWFKRAPLDRTVDEVGKFRFLKERPRGPTRR
jgi:spore germination cell wall hydrolase CwlJ-like protein